MKQFFLLIALFVMIGAGAQQTGVGQSCPDPVLPGVLNYTSPLVRLSEFRPKLVILDF
jgi:hypothetical protein